MKKIFFITTRLTLFIFFVSLCMPIIHVYAEEASSDNYKIQTSSIGGGFDDSASDNYKEQGGVRPVASTNTDSSNYGADAGFENTITADVVTLTLSNPSTYYDRLKLVVNGGDKASDYKFAVAISDDNFVADTRYVQDDNTVGATLGIEDFRTYSGTGGWGGASGVNILGLDSGTTYYVKASSRQGAFTQSRFGPVVNAGTSSPILTLEITGDTIAFGSLSTTSVNTASSTTSIAVTTNAQNGYTLKVNGAGSGSNPGMYSSGTSHLIQSSTTTLVAGTEGYGVQGTSSTADVDAVYDKTGNDVGILPLAEANFCTNTGPVTSESTVVTYKAAIGNLTVAASDYTDTVTYTLYGSF